MKNKLYSRALVSTAMILILVSIAGAAPFAYITNQGSNNISVIDTATDNVTAKVPVGNEPCGVAVTPDGTKVYVTDITNNVSVIDTATNTVTATVHVGDAPYGVAVTPDGKKAYVANYMGNDVSVIDTVSNTIISTVPVGDSQFPSGVAVTPDGTKAYVAKQFGNDISVIDIATDNVTATVPVGNGPWGVAVTPDEKVYVANSDSSTVSVIDTATNTVIATVPVGNNPRGVAISPDGTKVYVTNAGGNTVSVIDTDTNNVTATVPVGKYPNGVSVTPDGKKVYVANWDSNNVSVIDTATNTVIDTVNVGNNPYAFGQFIVPPVHLLVASFSTNVTSDYAPLTVQFTDRSINAAGWNWNFGDGTNSTQQNPVHTYSEAGNYTVTLTVSNANSTKSISAPITVEAGPKLVASFSTNVTSGHAPLTVQFTDQSINATVWNWNFGDGTNSTQQNPVHTYSEEGNYNVILTVSNTNSTKSISASITVYSEKYTFVTKWGSNGSDDGQFQGPYGVAVDSAGNVYVAENFGNRIQKFDSNSKFLAKWGSIGSGDGQFNAPYGIAIDSSGNVYVTENFGNRIQKFDSNDKFLAKWGSRGSGDGQFEAPSGIAIDSSGNVYVADNANYRIQKFDSNGNYITQWGSGGIGDGQFNSPIGVAVDSSGNVYIADTLSSRIEKFDSNGTFLAKWGSWGIGDGQFKDPEGVAVDSAGNVYVADWGNRRIQKFDSNGTFLAKWGSKGSGDGQFNSPIGVAVDSSGNVYVADSIDSRIQKFSPVISGLPVANFTSNVTSGKDPLTVQFTDLSTNVTSLYWDFGDGFNSTEQNPIHTYSIAGNYTVNLTAINGNGKDSKLATITVEAVPEKPIASFSETPTSGNAPVTVNFTDTSTGIPTWWKWSFGDGIYSTQQNPVHTYNRVGKFTVNLIVGNTYGINYVTKQNDITVTSPLTAPVANFSATPVSGSRPLKVTFTDISTGSPNSWIWSFGDGTYSTQQNPEHTYSKAGKYNVSLTARNSKGSNTKTMSGYIIVNK